MTNIAPGWAGAAPPGPGDAAALAAHWEQWLERARESGDAALAAFAESCQADPAARALLDALFGNSRYLARCLVADQAFARLLLERGPDDAFAAALATARDDVDPGGESRAVAMKRLRIAKRRASLAIGMADIAGAWPLEKVTAALSDFASAALAASSAHLLRKAHESGALALPSPDEPERHSGLIVLGMGKLGARELNYSSDVDVIVLFDEAAYPDTGGLQQTFARLARTLVTIMDERTADGYVFRTDLRLRPDPASTAAALSVRAAEVYYASAGENWERAAMIKARPVAGDLEAGQRFLDSLQPFVWRRHLDFAAIQHIRAIKRQIDAHRGGGGVAVAGHNVKLGRGGIREIEFLAQTQQLVWGGRDESLRVRGTGEALDRLVAAGHMRRRAATELMAAYAFHRTLEHRLQMIDDRQTHSMPEDEEGVAHVAAFMGFESAGAFSEAFLAHLRTVESHYATLFEDEPALAEAGTLAFAGADHDAETLETLAGMGYAAPERASATIRAWHAGRHRAVRSDEARDRMAALVPTLLEAFAAAPDPDSALALFDEFLARLPTGAHLFSMFAARPALFDLVAEIMASAPRLANRLGRRPVLLDSVLSREFSDLDVPDADEMEPALAHAARRGLVRLFYVREFGMAEMQAALAAEARRARDVQDFLDAERRWANDKVFHIGVHMLRGLLSPVEAAGPLSDIADACLAAALPAVADAFTAVHGRVPGGAFAAVALGRLGGREMTVSEALGLLFVYDHDPGAAASDGRKPLAPRDYYGRLARRVVAALAAPTAEGALYDVETSPGPVVAALPAFADGADDLPLRAHLALASARAVWAEGDLGARFEAARRAVLAHVPAGGDSPAALAGLREGARREGVEEDLWSIEHKRGGLIDVEFAARCLQLRHAIECGETLDGGTGAVFDAAGRLGLIDPEAAGQLADAATLWRNLHGILCLTVEGGFVEASASPALRAAIGRACGIADFDSLKEAVRETAARTTTHYDALLGPPPPGG